MNWITIAWPMVAGACLTLGLIELRVGLAQPGRAARLVFAVSAFAVASVSGFELALMRTDILAQWWPLMRLLDIAVGVMIVSLMAFIWVYFGTGNKWLALAVPSLYAVGLAFDYLPGSGMGSGMTYQKITGFRTVETFGGATFNVAEGVPNPWNVFPYLAVVALIVFVADASVRLWRRGGRRRAAVVGGAVVFFLLAAGGHSALVETGVVQMPYLISWAYLCVLVAMGHELSADIFAAARTARQLQDSERRMDLASDAAGLGMWTWDIIHDQLWATSRARSLFGFSESENLSLPRFMSALHPDDRDAVRHAIDSSRDYELEFRVLLPDGQTRWIAARGRADRDSAGKAVLRRGVVLDISARRRSEEELQQVQGQLAHVGRVSMLGQLAAALAHELGQPLGAILRNAEAAELFLQHEPPDLDELRAILADIRKDDQRAGDVIERLRSLLKRRSIEPRPLAVSDLLAGCAALTRADAAARRVKLEFEAEPALPNVMGDRVHLQQVLLNLVLNAMDAVEGEPADRRLVSVRAHFDGGRTVEVAVSDSGHGMTPERLALVFEPFFTTKSNGMGIGLPISRTIIEAHGGRIWAESNADKGATFRFTLPVSEEPVAKEGPPS